MVCYVDEGKRKVENVAASAALLAVTCMMSWLLSLHAFVVHCLDCGNASIAQSKNIYFSLRPTTTSLFFYLEMRYLLDT